MKFVYLDAAVFRANIVINAAGNYGDLVEAMHRMSPFTIKPRKGQFLVYKKTEAPLVNRLRNMRSNFIHLGLFSLYQVKRPKEFWCSLPSMVISLWDQQQMKKIRETILSLIRYRECPLCKFRRRLLEYWPRKD